MRSSFERTLASVALSGLCATLATGQCQVVVDLNATPEPISSQIAARAQRSTVLPQYAPFVQVAGRYYFVAETTAAGNELFSTDGTTAGTRLVADLVPGPGSSEPTGLWRADFAAGPRLVFRARDAGGANRLYVSDGTTAGTVALTTLGIEGFWARAGNQLVFPRGELWVTDGTPGGTRQLPDLEPGPGTPTIRNLTEEPTSGQVFFVARTTATGAELWVSDGSAAGTRLVRDITPGSADTRIGSMVSHQGAVYFDGPGGLWRSDGTAAGTLLLRSFLSVQLFDDTAIGNKLHFVADDPATGNEIYETDGTVAGTRLTVDLRPGVGGSSPRTLHANGNTLFTQASLPTGSEPVAWSNGTLTRLLPPGAVFQAFSFRGAGPLTYLMLRDFGSAGTELWSTDGTTAGTRQITEIYPGPESSNPRNFTPLGGPDALFVALDPVFGRELWRTDGTAPGTRLVSDIEPAVVTGDGLDQNLPWILNGEQAFLAGENSPATGSEPHTVPLGAPTATALGDLRTGPDDSFPTGFTSLFDGSSETILFSALDAAHGRELWATDGTPTNTRLVLDIAPGSRSSNPFGFTVLEDTCYFIAASNNRRELWKTDGTTAGTTLLSSLEVQSVALFRGQLVFSGNDGTTARLWTTDGTAAGTRPLANTSLNSLFQLTPDGDRRLFAVGRRANTGFELFVLDPNGNATLAADTRPGAGSGLNSILGVVNGRALLDAQDALGGVALLSSDGTPAGLQRLGNRVSAAASIGAQRAFFSNGDGTFATDGTLTGTVRIDGPSSAVLAVGPGCYHATTSGGTTSIRYSEPASPSRLLCTIPTGPTRRDPAPTWFRVVGRELWFNAIDPILGRELHSLGLPVGAYVTPLGGACGGSHASLHSDRPVLGSTMTVRGDRAPNTGGVLLFGRAAPGPVALPGIAACGIRFQPAATLDAGPILTTSWSTTIPVPNLPTLEGAELSAQALFLATPGSRSLIDSSDALRLLLGR